MPRSAVAGRRRGLVGFCLTDAPADWREDFNCFASFHDTDILASRVKMSASWSVEAMRVWCRNVGPHAFFHRCHVNAHYLRDGVLVSAGKIPYERYSGTPSGIKHDGIPFSHLVAIQNAT